MRKLNTNQINFCEQYILNDYNASKAYRIAYNTENSELSSAAGSKLLRDPRVLDKIKEVEGDYRVIGHGLGINKKLILLRLKEMLSAKKQVFANGVEIGVVDDNASVNKAIETILKIMGDFAPEKKEFTIEEEGVDISKMSDSEKKEYKERLIRELAV